MNFNACVNFTFVNRNNNGLRVPKGEINFMLSTIFLQAREQDERKTEKKREKKKSRRQGKQDKEQYMRVSPNVKGVVSFNYQLELRSPDTVFLPQFASLVNCHTFC